MFDAAKFSAIQSLLVPLDLTPSSDRVLGRLALLPLAADAWLTLLHVVPGSLPPSEQRSAANDARKALADEAQHLRKLLPKKVRIEPLIKLGTAAREIAACASKVKAELIVMGRGGGRALRDTFLGSTAERVVRQARIPVLSVRLPPRTVYTRPALALDLDPVAHEVVRFMLLVLASPRSRVAVIHAFDDPYQGLLYRTFSEDESQQRRDELRSNATQALEELLATALAKARIRPEDEPLWKTHVRYGPPRVVVEKALKNAEADLLVVGSRGYSAATYAFLGTVSGELLRTAKCDVLIVPPIPRRK